MGFYCFTIIPSILEKEAHNSALRDGGLCSECNLYQPSALYAHESPLQHAEDSKGLHVPINFPLT